MENIVNLHEISFGAALLWIAIAMSVVAAIYFMASKKEKAFNKKRNIVSSDHDSVTINGNNNSTFSISE